LYTRSSCLCTFHSDIYVMLANNMHYDDEHKMFDTCRRQEELNWNIVFYILYITWQVEGCW